MFRNIIARKPCPSVTEGITTANFGKPDYALALKQHEAYISALEKCGVGITLLDANDDYPDSCFVEDVALCTKKCAIITRPGALSRRGEAALPDIKAAVEKFFANIEFIKEPGTIEAGDIMMVGDHFYIGLSNRTNEDGARQMMRCLEKYGMSGSLVPLNEVLHLKTGLSYLENNNLLVCGEFVTKPDFAEFNRIEVPIEEAYAANCIWVNGNVLMPAGYPKTQKAVERLGYTVIPVDTSEYKKIDGGLSCLSLRF
ncbi:MAG: arginine deiminase family protein [Clostridiales bacterium]|nr:arginine deiminase family protein [Clostridiales bacterium]